MIENPVSKSDADYVKNVYETGLKEGETAGPDGGSRAPLPSSRASPWEQRQRAPSPSP